MCSVCTYSDRLTKSYDVLLPDVFLIGRFLYSDLQPLTEPGIAPDPHPEGPSSLPAEAPADIRKELASERRREKLRKNAVLTRLPRLTQVCIACVLLIADLLKS